MHRIPDYGELLSLLVARHGHCTADITNQLLWNCQLEEIWYIFSIRNRLLRQKG